MLRDIILEIETAELLVEYDYQEAEAGHSECAPTSESIDVESVKAGIEEILPLLSDDIIEQIEIQISEHLKELREMAA